MLEAIRPYLGKIVSTCTLLLVWIGLWRISQIERKLTALEEQSSKAVKPLVPLNPNEVLHEGMLWCWDGEVVVGPLCPHHREPLLYKLFTGPLQIECEERWLGMTGWFVCPNDSTEVFRVFDAAQVKQVRALVADRFRVKRHPLRTGG